MQVLSQLTSLALLVFADLAIAQTPVPPVLSATSARPRHLPLTLNSLALAINGAHPVDTLAPFPPAAVLTRFMPLLEARRNAPEPRALPVSTTFTGMLNAPTGSMPTPLRPWAFDKNHSGAK